MKKIRDMLATASHNDGTRSLRQSILVPELVEALRAWAAMVPQGWVLIGGLAFSTHAKPRQTMDVDVLTLVHYSPTETVAGFKKIRPHAMEHSRTGVEIEVLEPSTINMSAALAAWITETAVPDSSLGPKVLVASPSGVVASKLGRWNLRDMADADELMDHFTVDVSKAPLTNLERQRINALVVDRAMRRK